MLCLRWVFDISTCRPRPSASGRQSPAILPPRESSTRDETMAETENWMTVADRSSVEPGSVVAVKAGDLDVALYNIDGQLYATHNVCTHAHALLSDGFLEGDVIECPL